MVLIKLYFRGFAILHRFSVRSLAAAAILFFLRVKHYLLRYETIRFEMIKMFLLSERTEFLTLFQQNSILISRKKKCRLFIVCVILTESIQLMTILCDFFFHSSFLGVDKDVLITKIQFACQFHIKAALFIMHSIKK